MINALYVYFCRDNIFLLLLPPRRMIVLHALDELNIILCLLWHVIQMFHCWICDFLWICHPIHHIWSYRQLQYSHCLQRKYQNFQICYHPLQKYRQLLQELRQMLPWYCDRCFFSASLTIDFAALKQNGSVWCFLLVQRWGRQFFVRYSKIQGF